MLKRLKLWWKCKVWNRHTWTCKAMEGIQPTEKELTIDGWKEYAKMYCKDCGKESILNEKLK